MFHCKKFNGGLYSVILPLTEILLDYGGELYIGRSFRIRDGAKICVRKGTFCIIGKNTAINSNNMIAYYRKIVIVGNIQFVSNIQIYD